MILLKTKYDVCTMAQYKIAHASEIFENDVKSISEV